MTGATTSRSHAAIAAMLDAVVIIDAEGVVGEFNPAAEELFGWRRDEAVGQLLHEFLIPGRFRDAIQEGRAAAVGASVLPGRRLRVPALHRDGHELEVELSVTRIEGDPPAFVGVMRAIHGSEAPDALAGRHAWRYRALLDRLPGTSVIVFDRAMQIVDADLMDESAMSAGELIGRRIEDFVLDPNRASWLKDRYRGALNGEAQSFEWEDERRPGRWVDCEIVPIIEGESDRVSGGMVIIREVTERKRVEARLRLHSEVLDQLDAAVLAADAHGRIVAWNAGAQRMLGHDADAAIGRDALELIELRGVTREQFVAAFVSGDTWHGEVEARNGRGVWLPVLVACKAARDAEGRVESFIAVAVDLTERRAAEAALRQSEQRFRAIVETSRDGVWTLDGEGFTTFVNPRMAELLGWEPGEMLGRPLADFAADPGLDLARLDGEVELRRRDGGSIVALMSTSRMPSRRAGVAGWLVMATDITERVLDEREREQLRAALHQSQKLEGIGRLAGGIAHDFNNLLAVIINYADFVAEDVADRPEVLADVREIAGAADRAAALTRQLLVFGRRDVATPEVLDVADVIEDMEKLLRRTIGEDVSLAVEVNGACRVRADRSQLEQIVLNLAINARDAMATGGSLRIRTSRESVDALYARSRPGLVEGDYVALVVEDTGIGMTPEQIARAFEPFYTTKPAGMGTGLGLATVYGVVTRARGHVGIYSEPSRGTAVRVLLPAVEAAVAPAPAPVEDARAGAGERVLLVEDEEGVRHLTARVLRNNGYRVSEAPDPAHALQLPEVRAGEVDLLLTDLVMPGISGKELAEELHTWLPDLPVVYMSGYTDDALMRHGIREENVVFIQKPFNAPALLNKVRATLDRAAA